MPDESLSSLVVLMLDKLFSSISIYSKMGEVVVALKEPMLRVLIAPSFGEIFANNCFKNGLLPVVLDLASVETLFQQAATSGGLRVRVDLDKKTIETSHGQSICFDVDGARRERLLHGLDDIGETLLFAEAVRDYESARKVSEPWLFEAMRSSTDS